MEIKFGIEGSPLVAMIYLTQIIYIKDGQEEMFHQFEDIIIPIISKYNGKLLLRMKPNEQSLVEHCIDKPYEIHIVEFNSEKDFENFRKDEERMKYSHLKEQSVETSILIQGKRVDEIKVV